jgi:hypothetical protein
VFGPSLARHRLDQRPGRLARVSHCLLHSVEVVHAVGQVQANGSLFVQRVDQYPQALHDAAATAPTAATSAKGGITSSVCK